MLASPRPTTLEEDRELFVDFIQFHVYDFSFKAWGPTNFLTEFQTLYPMELNTNMSSYSRNAHYEGLDGCKIIIFCSGTSKAVFIFKQTLEFWEPVSDAPCQLGCRDTCQIWTWFKGSNWLVHPPNQNSETFPMEHLWERVSNSEFYPRIPWLLFRANNKLG